MVFTWSRQLDTKQGTQHRRSVIEPRVISGLAGIGKLIESLRGRGFNVIGPSVDDGAIRYKSIDSADDLPVGYAQTLGPGSYALEKRDDTAVFGFTIATNSPKDFLFPARETIWSATKQNGRIESIKPTDARDEQPFAFLGVRGCELSAIRIQDRVFTGGPSKDTRYGVRRGRSFVVGVNCTVSSSTCFCTSMGTGPRIDSDLDIAITEVVDAESHFFLAEPGSDVGKEILAEIGALPASTSDVNAATKAVSATENSIERKLRGADLRVELTAAREGNIWTQIAERCLACGNCTMVCPTCFCSDYKDVAELDDSKAEKTRRWDTCFSSEYSFIAGGSARSSTAAKYRQWMTHKLATWHDQFGTQGCVGCGRCTVWCPAGIDFAAEAAKVSEAYGNVDSDGELK